MEEKSPIVDLASFPHPEDVVESSIYLKDPLKDLLSNDLENSLAFQRQMTAGAISGAAVSIVSYRIFKTRSLKTVFQSKSVAKDMTYLGVLYGAAEVSQQMFIGEARPKTFDDDPSAPRADKLDLAGVKNVALFGASVAAPFFHFWYRFLDTRFVGTTPLTIAKKVVLDQLVASSSVSALFLVAIPGFQGETDLAGSESLLRRKFLSIYLTGCVFWPLAQIINFRFVAPRYRVAYLGCAAFLWTNIMCFSRH